MDANLTFLDFLKAAVEQMEADDHNAVGFVISTPEGRVSFRLEITDFVKPEEIN